MPDSKWYKTGMLAGVTTLVAALSACSSSAPRESDASSIPLDTQIEAGSFDGDRQRGIELRVLTVDDSGDRVARTLARFEQSHGVMDETDFQQWRDWGLRWVVVPIDQLDSVIAAQEMTKAIQIRWMGEFASWRPIIRTGQINNQAVRIGRPSNNIERKLTGRPRLLGRVWTVPEVTDSGVVAKLHLDLAVQIYNHTKQNSWEAITPPMALDEGMLIDELKMSLSLDSSQALILIGEDPSVQWIGDAGQETGSVSVSRDGGVGGIGGLGPSVPGSRTLGQRMLSTPGTGYVSPEVRYVAPKKVLLILVPKADGRYRLLGPTSINSSQRVGGTP